MSTLFDRMEELGIKAMMRDDINNKIHIYMTDSNNSMKKDMITEIVPSDCVEFEKGDIKLIFQTDTASIPIFDY